MIRVVVTRAVDSGRASSRGEPAQLVLYRRGGWPALPLAAPPTLPTTVAVNAKQGIVHIADQTNTQVRIAVKAGRPSVLVLTDRDYRNWTATVDR